MAERRRRRSRREESRPAAAAARLPVASVAPAPSLPAAAAGPRWLPWLGALVLVLLTVVAYRPALDAGWVWDDDDYVTDNAALRTPDGLRRIWLEPGATPQWYPATFTSLWLEWQVHGLDPRGYHRTNVLLHALNALLAWAVLRQLAVPGAFLAAALFALHPVHVESVAWVTERKNVLSGAFFLAALWCWLRAALGGGRAALWAASFVLYGGALLAKSVTVTLPLVAVLLVWWRRGRLERRDLLVALPFVLVGVAAGLMTIWVERTVVGAQGVHWDLSPQGRVLIAGRALWFYLHALVWPQNLTFVYPRWEVDAAVPWQWLFPLAALGAAAVLWAARGRLGLGPLLAAACFAILLAPALGFVDVYPMRYSFVADHFQYLASLAPLALVAAIVWRGGRPAWLAAGVAIAVLGVLTWRQAHAYRDAETLWRDTLAKNPSAAMAHVNLGMLLYGQGRVQEAVREYEQALAVAPPEADVVGNLGIALHALGRPAEARARFEEAVALAPGDAGVRLNLANGLAAAGEYDRAVAEYLEALRRRPAYPDAHANLGNVLVMQGRVKEARAHYEAALELDPEFAEAHRNLALLLVRLGNVEGARAHLTAAIRLRPSWTQPREDLAQLEAEGGGVAAP
ncbi:MAG: tetratricopeptide repeat protein [bacterium]|nr:tetratricopeptide repeat protein [bacterium]